MRRSILAASAALTLTALALPGVASAYCATASASTSAIRGPHYAGAIGTAGCGDYTYLNVNEGNVGTAVQQAPGYTNPKATGVAYGGSGETATYAEAMSEANLADASLHGTATSVSNALAFSNSSWSETLYFTNTTDVNQYLTIGWLVEGSATWNEGSSAQVISNFTIGTRHQQGIQEGYLGYFYSNGSTYDINGAYNAFGWWPEYPGQGGLFGAAYEAYDLGGQSRLMTSVFGIAPGTHIVDITGFMNLDSRLGSSLDYSSTGALKFGAMPTGVSFTSDSGVFNPGRLTIPGAVSGVPEPGVWALMITGFGMLGSALRRRRPVLIAQQ